jgi:hypothetical protein
MGNLVLADLFPSWGRFFWIAAIDKNDTVMFPSGGFKVTAAFPSDVREVVRSPQPSGALPVRDCRALLPRGVLEDTSRRMLSRKSVGALVCPRMMCHNEPSAAL